MNICFIEHIYGSLDCGEKSGRQKWQGYYYRLHCLLFVFVGPIVGVLHSLEVPNNEELGILLAVIFTFVAHRLFISDGQYLSIADKYRNETKEKQRQRMKQVWIF